eukprot:3488880-Amphidinium_carterae.1
MWATISTARSTCCLLHGSFFNSTSTLQNCCDSWAVAQSRKVWSTDVGSCMSGLCCAGASTHCSHAETECFGLAMWCGV